MTLINVICIIVVAVAALFFIGVHKKGTFELDPEKELSEENLKKSNRDSPRLFFSKILSLCFAAASVLLYYFTDKVDLDFDNIILYNKWSIFHVILLLLFFLVIIWGLKGLNKVTVVDNETNGSGSSLYLD